MAGELVNLPSKGLGCAVVIPLLLDGTTLKPPTTKSIFQFQFLSKDCEVKVPVPAGAASSKKEYRTWEGADDIAVRTEIFKKIYNAVNGLEESSDDSSGGGKYPSITLGTNDIPSNTAVTDHKSFLKEAMEWYETPCLVCYPLGVGVGAVDAGDCGFATIVGVLNSEIASKPGESIKLTFEAAPYTWDSSLDTALATTGYLGSATPLKASAAVTFPDIAAGDIVLLKAGKMALL